MHEWIIQWWSMPKIFRPPFWFFGIYRPKTSSQHVFVSRFVFSRQFGHRKRSFASIIWRKKALFAQPEIDSVVVLGDWLSGCCLRNALLLVTITFVLASQACRLLVAQWYETRGIVDTRDTCAVSRYFFTATIYRGISWLWRYWYRHVSINDKYRGIAGIVQYY